MGASGLAGLSIICDAQVMGVEFGTYFSYLQFLNILDNLFVASCALVVHKLDLGQGLYSQRSNECFNVTM